MPGGKARVTQLTYREIYDGLAEWKRQLFDTLKIDEFNHYDVHRWITQQAHAALSLCRIPDDGIMEYREGFQPTMNARRQGILALLSPDQPTDDPKCPEDVSLSHVPWISGTRAQNYYGPVMEEILLPQCLDDWQIRGIVTTLRRAQKAGFKLGANYLVGVEIEINPSLFCRLPWVGELAIVRVHATAGRLVSLWPEEDE